MEWTVGEERKTGADETVVDEVLHLADAGLGTIDAVRAATTIAGPLLGPRANTGALAAGLRADLLLVEGSLGVAGLRVLRDVRCVVAGGMVVHDRSAVDHRVATAS